MGTCTSSTTAISVSKKTSCSAADGPAAAACFTKDGMPAAKLYLEEQSNFSIHQLFTPCLAEMAYIVLSGKEAAIIDPLREIEPYLDLLAEKGVKLKYIFETHFHADFVSGHFDLSNKTGAQIVFGPTASAQYSLRVAQDNEIFKVGKVSIKVLHTPGHTMESSCFVLLDEGREHCVFTGDTLFLGEVGRPDLAVKAGEITKEDLAGFLYDSLRLKVMKLDPKTIIYPGHGAGSACGKNISTGTFCTLEKQLKNNYALQDMTREAFIVELTRDLPTPPQYFFHDAAQNKQKVEPVNDILEHSLNYRPLPPIEELDREGVVLIDTRASADFRQGFIKGAISLPLAMNFAPWIGTLFPPTTKFFLASEKGKETEAVLRLARIGYDQIVGVLEGGVDSYLAGGHTLDVVEHIPAEQLTPEMIVYDVRNGPELLQGKIEHAIPIPLADVQKLALTGKLEEKFPKDKKIYLHCKGGARSLIASSILRKHGYDHVVNIEGGYDAVKEKNTVLKFTNV